MNLRPTQSVKNDPQSSPFSSSAGRSVDTVSPEQLMNTPSGQNPSGLYVPRGVTQLETRYHSSATFSGPSSATYYPSSEVAMQTSASAAFIDTSTGEASLTSALCPTAPAHKINLVDNNNSYHVTNSYQSMPNPADWWPRNYNPGMGGMAAASSNNETFGFTTAEPSHERAVPFGQSLFQETAALVAVDSRPPHIKIPAVTSWQLESHAEVRFQSERFVGCRQETQSAVSLSEMSGVLSPPDDESTIQALEDATIDDGATSPSASAVTRLHKRDIERKAREKGTESYKMIYKSLMAAPDALKKTTVDSVPRKFKTKNGLDEESFKNADEEKRLGEFGRANCVAHAAVMIKSVYRAL